MIKVDYRDKTPIYEQITNKIQTLIAVGVLKPDDKLPSVRALSVELSINPNTIQKAYMALEMTGAIYSVKGIGNFVADNSELMRKKKLATLKQEIQIRVDEAKFYGLSDTALERWLKEFKGGKG